MNQLSTEPCHTDRPGRPLEHITGQAEQLASMTSNIQERLHDLLGRLHQGNAPAILGQEAKGQPQESLPELPNIERALARAQRNLESILDATNGLEAL